MCQSLHRNKAHTQAAGRTCVGGWYSPGLVGDIVRCCSLERAAAAVDAALTLVSQMAVNETLQEALLDAGALPHLIPLLFCYDNTFEDEALPGGESSLSRGPSFLGLGIERATVQVRVRSML